MPKRYRTNHPFTVPDLMETSWERGCRKACTFQKNSPVPCEVAYCHKTTCHVAPSHVWLVQFLRKPHVVIFQRIWSSSSSLILFSCITILQSIAFSQIDSRSMPVNGRNGGGVCMYLRNNINHQIRDDLCVGQLECVVIEIIRPHSRPCFVSTWYKPPNSAQDVFRHFESLVDKVDSE